MPDALPPLESYVFRVGDKVELLGRHLTNRGKPVLAGAIGEIDDDGNGTGEIDVEFPQGVVRLDGHPIRLTPKGRYESTVAREGSRLRFADATNSVLIDPALLTVGRRGKGVSVLTMGDQRSLCGASWHVEDAPIAVKLVDALERLILDASAPPVTVWVRSEHGRVIVFGGSEQPEAVVIPQIT